MARKLPIGIQSFAKMRSGGFVYVDKTVCIYQLVQAQPVFHLGFNGADYTREGGHEKKTDAPLPEAMHDTELEECNRAAPISSRPWIGWKSSRRRRGMGLPLDGAGAKFHGRSHAWI